jgi:enoyl-CoA hydratase/carnithine racemase
MTPGAAEVAVEADDGVLVMAINRPQARNAVSLSVAHAMAGALERLDADASVHVGVLTGTGGVFCAGMDLKGFARGERPSLPGRGFAGLTERPPVKPLIAAVEGFALGGGCELALACDIIVAADDATFGLPEVTHGLVPAGGGLLRLPQKVPANVAMEWILTGDRVPARRGYEVGLVNRLTPPGEALPTALEIARRIASHAPLAVRAGKRIQRLARTWPADEAFDRQRPLSEPVMASADAQEGARAFAERRRPRWTGA